MRAELTEEQQFASVAEELKQQRQPQKTSVSRWFVAFMGLIALICLSLGFWQMQRLAWKEELIARVEARIDAGPAAFPPAISWNALDPESFDFQPVELTGTFVPGETILVFTALNDPNGPRSGIGYWVVTPLALRDGGTVFVNRGFVPESAAGLFQPPAVTANTPRGEQTLTGLARAPEQVGAFTPGPDAARGIEYVRSTGRLAALTDPALAPFAPVYVDAAAGTGSGLPQGGETKISFPNRHFEYMLTWFSLAAVTIVMTGIWLWRRRLP